MNNQYLGYFVGGPSKTIFSIRKLFLCYSHIRFPTFINCHTQFLFIFHLSTTEKKRKDWEIIKKINNDAISHGNHANNNMTTNRGGGGISANSANKRKVVVSYTVRNEAEPGNRLGVNALQYDPKVNRLFTAGRDSIIRCWSPDGDKVKRRILKCYFSRRSNILHLNIIKKKYLKIFEKRHIFKMSLPEITYSTILGDW